MGQIDKRLEELGIEIPTPAAPVANYVGWVRTGNLVFTSGQVPLKDGEFLYKGIVPDECSEEDAVKAARLCAINIIAQLKDACGGDLDRLARTADRHEPILHMRDRCGRNEEWIEYHPAYREMEKIAFGPPAESVAKLLSLMRAKRLTFGKGGLIGG